MKKEIYIEVTPKLKAYIAVNEIDVNYGARQLKRKLQEIIENRIAEEILQGNLKKGQKIIFDIKDKEIFITKIYTRTIAKRIN